MNTNKPKMLKFQFSLPICHFSFYAGLAAKAIFETSILFEFAHRWKTIGTFTTGAIQPHPESVEFNLHDN